MTAENRRYNRIRVNPPESLMTRADLEKHFQVDARQIAAWETDGLLPPPDLVIGPRIEDKRWRRETIEGAIRRRFASLQPAAPTMMMAPEDVANFLRVDYHTVTQLVRSGRLPPADGVIGNRPRWFFETIKGIALAGKI